MLNKQLYSDLVSGKERLELFNLLFLSLVLFEVYACSNRFLPRPSFSQHMVNAAEFKVVLHPRGQVEGVTAREVAQHHQVAERLHNVPTQVVEGAQNDECELTYDN